MTYKPPKTTKRAMIELHDRRYESIHDFLTQMSRRYEKTEAVCEHTRNLCDNLYGEMWRTLVIGLFMGCIGGALVTAAFMKIVAS